MQVRRLLGIGLALVALAACGSSSHASNDATTTKADQVTVTTTSRAAPTDDAACQAAMKRYHDGLVSTNDNLTGDQEAAYQAATVNSCSRSEWMNDVQPYNGSVVGDQVGNLVVGGRGAADNRARLLKAMCGGNENAPACQ